MSFDNMNDGSNNQTGLTGQTQTGRTGYDQGQGQDQFSSSTGGGAGGMGGMGSTGGGYDDLNTGGGMRDPSRTDDFSNTGTGAGTGYGAGGMQAGGTDDFSTTGAGSGVGFGSGAGMQGGGMQGGGMQGGGMQGGFDADERDSGRTGGKPSMGDKLKGGAEKLAGKMTGNADKQERGQERQRGELNETNNY